LLAEELLRVQGFDFNMKNSVSVDVQTIFIKEERADRCCFKKFYCE
jgi:DNA polymerase-3 subunit epsilon